MFNPKISGAFAGAGFVLSLLVGLVTGAHLPLLLIRAFIFAAVFFALASAGYGAIQLYLPELLSEDAGDVPALGSQVDISIGDDSEVSGDVSLESGGPGDDLNDFMENPGISGGDTLDQTGEAVYTERGAPEEELQGPSKPALPDNPDFSSGDTDSVDMLPDLDAMSGAFSSGPVFAGGEAAGPGASAGSLGGAGGQSKKQGLGEDFNVKEMASAVQTILKRENKG
ncbi:MAG: hypothetical protein LBG14_07475 [Treponema sp.]|jgi:hypothetical protein|nr:hypothetical protein [Treponema sp.]